jgi:UDP-GlcNAc:undecaprenyl-phosphate GlcNAc-1-phosphate transferase
MLKYLVLFISASIFSLLLTPLVRSVAIKLGALDLPDERKIHGKPIPRLGGFSIYVTFILILFVSYQFDFFFYPANFLREINFGWLLTASAIVFGLGAFDDFKRIPPSIKFFVQIIAGLIVALTSYRIQQISLPFGSIQLGIWSIPATVLWIVAITNALNLLDGLDGLAAGTSFIVSLSMFGISLLNESIGMALLSIILAGSILGFLKYNFHPASIFLGDSGAYTLGFILSILSLQSNLKGTTTVVFLIPILVLGLPIMDTILSMLRRLLKSLHIIGADREKNMLKFLYFKGSTVFSADRGHIHHRLLQMGVTQKNAVVILYAVTLLLGTIALATVYFRNINQALLISSIGIASYIGLRKLGYSEIQFLRNGALLPLFDLYLVSQRMFKVFVDIAFIALAYYLAFLLRFEGEFDPAIKKYYLSTIPLVLSVKLLVFYFAGLYKGAWRYINVDDFLRILKAVVFGCVMAGLFLWMIPSLGIASWPVLFIDFNLLFLFIAGARSSFRVLEHLHLANNHQGRKVLIYGVEKGSVYALDEFISNPRLNLSPVGFIDDDQRNQGKQVNGYPVLGSLDSLENIVKDHSISEIIVSQDDIPQEKLDRLSEICSSCQIALRRFQTKLEEIPYNGRIQYG